MDFINKLNANNLDFFEKQENLYYSAKHNLALRVIDLVKDNVNTTPDIIKQNKALQSVYESILFFFKDELEKKTDLCMSMILNKLKIKTAQETIRASELELREIKRPSEYKDFFNRNHLNGFVQSSSGYGLFRGQQLISAILFRKAFTDGSFEISRFCTDYNIRVHGAFSRMISRWPKDQKLVTYSDGRFSNGNVYSSNGFQPIKIEHRSSYWYTDGINRFYRTACQKLSLSKFNPDMSKTEEQLAAEGYFGLKFYGKMTPMYKVFDVGHLKWGINLNSDVVDRRNFIVYKYQSRVDGKCYVGITGNEEQRQMQHKTSGYEFSGYKRMVDTYGEDQIEYVVLNRVMGLETAQTLEMKYIKEYDSIRNGFNRTAGGEGCQVGKVLEEKHIKEIREDLQKEVSFREIAKKYGVNESTIRSVERGKTWKHYEYNKILKPKAYSKGEHKYNAVLTEELVKQIQILRMEGKSRSEIASQLNIKPATVGNILTGASWKHVVVEGYDPEKYKEVKYQNTLTQEIVNEIRELFDKGIKQMVLSRKFNVSRTTIKKIITRETWK